MTGVGADVELGACKYGANENKEFIWLLFGKFGTTVDTCDGVADRRIDGIVNIPLEIWFEGAPKAGVAIVAVVVGKG